MSLCGELTLACADDFETQWLPIPLVTCGVIGGSVGGPICISIGDGHL